MFLAKIYEKLPAKIKKQVNKLYTYFPDREVTIEIDGIWYRLDLSKLVHAQIYYYGYWEKYTSLILEKYIKPDMTVLDIGASTGVHTLRMAKLANHGLVYAFEPSDWMYERLLRNINLNNFRNIITEKIALGDETKTAPYLSEQHDRVDKKPNPRETIQIQYMKLDDYFAEGRIKALDFIKMDVDGFECRILEGGIETIKKYKPLMIIEIGKNIQEAYGRSLRKMIDLLSSLGYKFYNERTEEEYKSLIDELPEDATVNVLCKVK